MSDSKTSIPKFGSFRPKSDPNLALDSKEEKSKLKCGSRGSREKSREHDRSHGSGSEQAPQARRHRSRSRDRRSKSSERRARKDRSHDVVEVNKPQSVAKDSSIHLKTGNQHDPVSRADKSRYRLLKSNNELGPTSTEDPAIFVIDRKGDEKNLVYGSIHRYSVPPFYRYGAGYVLGASCGTRIDRSYGEEKGLVLNSSRNPKNKLREKYVFSKIEREKHRLLKLREDAVDNQIFAQETDYVPLARTKRKNQDGITGGEDIALDYDDTDYRSIHGKAKAEEVPLDENFEYAEESDSSESGTVFRIDASVRQRNVDLSRRVEQFPKDIEAWISLIEHQDKLIGAGNDRQRITNAEISSTAEIKISMFEKALETSKSLKDRERLLLGLMGEGSKIWEAKVQSQRWEKISRDNIESLTLWTSYLNFRQTAFTTFRFEEVRDNIYLQRISLLLEAIPKAEDMNSLYEQLIYVLLRLTLFTREAGFSELAVAIWQVLLELNFCDPRESLSRNDCAARFQGYWDSEVPRIGEHGSLGWCNFTEDSSAMPESRIDEETSLSLGNIRNLFRQWCTAERSRSQKSRNPARTMDDVFEDDPYRVILFSDIEPFLISLPNSERLNKILLDAFLSFCRLPPMVSFNPEGSMNSCSRDSFIRGEFLEVDSKYVRENILASPTKNLDEIELPGIESITSTQVTNFASSPESLFSEKWFCSLRPWREVYAGDQGPLTYSFVRNTLMQLTSLHFREDLAEYYLAFEWRNEPESIKKVAKKLLKQHPSNIRLYNAYATIEWARGNKDIARSVFSAALSMRKTKEVPSNNGVSEAQTMPNPPSTDSILLWKSWIWACLGEGDSQAALQHLLCIVDGKPNASATISAASLLKTQQHLSSNQDSLLISRNPSEAIIYTECLALLEYLTTTSPTETQSSTQGNITSTLTIFTDFSQTLINHNLIHSTSHELLLQSSTRLLHHHIRSGPFRPSLICHHLTQYLILFPQNTIFLSLYSWNETRLRIDNRVRKLLLSTILTTHNDTVTSRLFAIQYEISHGTIYSIRSAFENAVNSPACQGSEQLWRLYILFCAGREELRRGAKDVWLRAVRACPWAKEVYLIGFEEIDVVVEEGRGVWKVLGEKELRVCVDLEEGFGEMS